MKRLAATLLSTSMLLGFGAMAADQMKKDSMDMEMVPKECIKKESSGKEYLDRACMKRYSEKNPMGADGMKKEMPTPSN